MDVGWSVSLAFLFLFNFILLMATVYLGMRGLRARRAVPSAVEKAQKESALQGEKVLEVDLEADIVEEGFCRGTRPCTA